MNKTLLIADSGSTKTDWLFVSNDGRQTELHTSGINPARDARDIIYNVLYHELLPFLPQPVKIEDVHFYGAGCIEPFSQAVREAIEELFPGCAVEVESDLLGAARALCGNEPGIACILGTGSNSCFFDGEQVVKNVHSSGFILGDEGGGAALGRLFLSDFLKDLMPVDLAREFAATFQVDYPTVVREVYKNPAPAAYLGSFAPWILNRAAEPGYARDLVQSNFRAFCTRCLLQYDVTAYPVGIVGGFGKAAQDLFLPIAAEYGIRVSGFQDDIIDSLVKYHYER